VKKKVLLYLILIIVAVSLFVLSITLLANTKIIAPIIIVLSVYLFLGGVIKLCRLNDKFKDTVMGILDLLFWLP